MKSTKVIISLLSIFCVAFAISASANAATIALSCDQQANSWCTGGLWVSSGLGAGKMMTLQSITPGKFAIKGLPPQITPPAPGQAHTITTGSIGMFYLNIASGTVVYDVVENGKTISTCTYNFSADSPANLVVTGSCTNGLLAAPVNVIDQNTVDIGITGKAS